MPVVSCQVLDVLTECPFPPSLMPSALLDHVSRRAKEAGAAGFLGDVSPSICTVLHVAACHAFAAKAQPCPWHAALAPFDAGQCSCCWSLFPF